MATTPLCTACIEFTEHPDPDESIARFRRAARASAFSRCAQSPFPLPLGRVRVRPAARRLLLLEDIWAAVGRHQWGDWEKIPAVGAADNDFAVVERRRVRSRYRAFSGVDFEVTTNRRRSETIVLLPSTCRWRGPA